MSKIANTHHPVIDLIRKRWSPRSFSEKAISTDDVHTLIEAASWAASAMNEQPWRYYYAFRGNESFDNLWNCLLPGNQPWAKHAAVLMVSVAKTSYADGKPNATALHDTGMANANLLIQATSMDIYGHLMGGFDKEKTKATLRLEDDLQPVCMIALGYLNEAHKLEEPFRSRELTPRRRHHIDHISKEL